MTRQLDLCREVALDSGIKSKLFVDGIYICDVVEPPYRSKYGCIPPGEYDLTMLWSAKFKRLVPYLIDVPGRSGIEFHPGNNPLKDSKGCLLPGYSVDNEIRVINSQIAMNVLCANLVNCDSIHLTIYEMFV